MNENRIKPLLEPTNEISVRDNFVNSVVALSQRYYQSVLVDNPGTLSPVSNSILMSIPVLDFVTDGDLALGGGIAKSRTFEIGQPNSKSSRDMVGERIDELPIEQVIYGQKAFDTLIDIVRADVPFQTTQRLKQYLPVVLPDTREGLLVLKEVCQKVRGQLAPEENRIDLTENLKTLTQVLVLLEDEFMSRALEDMELEAKFLELAGNQARNELIPIRERDGVDHIEGLKVEVAQNKLSKLKETKVSENVGGEEREFSQLDNELYLIIQERNLEDRLQEGKENQTQIIEKRKIEALQNIVKRRGCRKIAGLMLSDPILLEMAAKISGLAPEEILEMKNDEGLRIRTNIASQLIDAPKKKLLRLGFISFPNFDQVFEEETQKLNQALELGDPLLFAAQLSNSEFDLVRKIIPNIFKRKASIDNRALFALAKDELLKKVASETTDDELINLMAEKINRTLIRKLGQKMIDQTIASLEIDPQNLIDNPYSLFEASEKIILTALQNINVDILELLKTSEITQAEDEQNLVSILPQFNPQVRQRSTELEQIYNESTSGIDQKKLGPIAIKEDISSSEGPFQYFTEYKTRYPDEVLKALANLYAEYNQSFEPLVRANIESDTDYQYCLTGPDGSPVNYFVQIDMVGLSDRYLQKAANLDVKQVENDLRGRIFEIENSVAMYQLLMKIFSSNGEPSNWDIMFRQGLDNLRNMFNRPIALLAVTEDKFNLMKGAEFGRSANDRLTDNEIMDKSGFDTFFGPDEFKNYLIQNNGKCDYLLYVRSSDPVAKLRDPRLAIKQPLLTDSELRRIIKANTITMNIDNPAWTRNSQRKINDTKAYLPAMGMAYPLFSFRDFKSPDLSLFLQSQGVDTELIESGRVVMRAKPMTSSYGCYGHLRGNLNDTEFKKRLAQNIRRRGPYVIQPEMRNASIKDQSTGNEFVYIDRNFFSFIGGVPSFIGGERTLMLTNSDEASKGRIHGNESTITAEVF